MPNVPTSIQALARVPETPRRRKPNASQRLQGIKTNLPMNLSVTEISRRLIETFKLSYIPDDFQTHTIRRVFQGYDCIFCAGTGYGKSLVFQGLAALGGKGKAVLVISPLKALERDQANEAKEKGIDVLVINEDTEKTAEMWKRARASAALIYMSPEMALADSFLNLWKESRLITKLW